MAVLQAQEVVVKAVLLNKMKHYLNYILLVLPLIGFSQNSIQEVLKKYNSESIPYITATELASNANNVLILDARELNEYKISHLKASVFVGYENFDTKTVIKKVTNKNQPIVVYCSVGVRSEDIAEQLKKAGFTNIKNLYGGIFEWKNLDFDVYNSKGQVTDSVHTFSEKWSKWLKKGTKVYTH